jgi:nondiscriminating glutamyl-tRNA synthetase
MDIYQYYLKHLMNSQQVYHCFCTPERLSQEREKAIKENRPIIYDRLCSDLPLKTIEYCLSQSRPFTIRLRMSNEIMEVNDAVHGIISFNSQYIDDPILIKSDGFPTYHFANVIDDYCMKITHVLRGEVRP